MRKIWKRCGSPSSCRWLFRANKHLNIAECDNISNRAAEVMEFERKKQLKNQWIDASEEAALLCIQRRLHKHHGRGGEELHHRFQKVETLLAIHDSVWTNMPLFRQVDDSRPRGTRRRPLGAQKQCIHFRKVKYCWPVPNKSLED